MSTTYSRAYLLTKVLTASNREVILYLYEGALSSLIRAAESREKKDPAGAGEEIDRVISILIELSGCLDYDQNGELALRLDSIYNYMIDVLGKSNKNQDVDALQTCEGVMTILCDAWRQAIESEGESETPQPITQLQLSA